MTPQEAATNWVRQALAETEHPPELADQLIAIAAEAGAPIEELVRWIHWRWKRRPLEAQQWRQDAARIAELHRQLQARDAPAEDG